METADRRIEILRVLCRRRYEKTRNLAYEFGVSERTIRRDIEFLSLRNPIYTQTGKYGGGIYVLDNFTMDGMYMTDTEINVLKNVSDVIKGLKAVTKREKEVLNSIISDYSKPKIREESKK